MRGEPINPYMYAYDNPVTVRDPSGKCPPCLVGLLAGGALGLAAGYLGQVWTHSQDHNFQGNPLTDQLDWAVIGGSAVGGAVALGTLGAGTFFEATGAVTTIAAGAAGGQAARLTQNGLHGLYGQPMTERIGDTGDMGWDGLNLLLGAGAFHIAGRVVGPPLARAANNLGLSRILNRTGGPIVPVNEGTGRILLRNSTEDTTVGSGLANVAEGSSIPPSYPPSTTESEAAAQQLIQRLRQTGIDPRSSNGRAAGVAYHEDGSVSVAFSGSEGLVRAVNEALQRQGLQENWTLGPERITAQDVHPEGLRDWFDNGRNRPGRAGCVECRLSVVARTNPSPVQGWTILQWGGTDLLPHTDPLTGILRPCGSCTVNVDRIMEQIIVVPRR